MRRLILLFLGNLLYGMCSAASAAPATLSPVKEEREEDQADEVEGQVSEFIAYLGTHWGNAQREIRSTATGTIERENMDSLIYSRMVAVTATHGIPVNDDTVWNNDLYKPLPDYWGIAVMIGYLTYSTS